MVMTATSWAALLWLHYPSLLARTCCGWDRTGGRLSAQCIQRARSCASPCVFASTCCLEGWSGSPRTPTHLHCMGCETSSAPADRLLCGWWAATAASPCALTASFVRAQGGARLGWGGLGPGRGD